MKKILFIFLTPVILFFINCCHFGKVESGDPDDPHSTRTISQFGITWTFAEPVPSGQFVNGDYWVVGPVEITAINPAPENGRNGSAVELNVAGVDYTMGTACWDDRIEADRYNPEKLISLPLVLQPGQSLISTVSVEEIGELKSMLRGININVPVRAAAVLTCLEQSPPADAFRPGYADPDSTLFLADNVQRQLLPQLPRPEHIADISKYEGYLQRPWLDVAYDEFTAPADNMPIYGREYTRIIAMATLLLCLDFTPAEKETLLIRLVQIGIDLRGLLKAGYLGWPAVGGHGNGRKLLLLLTGVLLEDTEMQRPDIYFPEVKFSEDMQTMYADGWTGASAVYAGHAGSDGHPWHDDWGAYEHLHPSAWPGRTGEDFRRCCTSIAWVGEATAAKILGLHDIWNHNAFFDYVERWMTEDDTGSLQVILQETGIDFSADWQVQGQAWDAFVEDMWHLYWF